MARCTTATVTTTRGIGGITTTAHPTGVHRVIVHPPTGRQNRFTRSRPRRRLTRSPDLPRRNRRPGRLRNLPVRQRNPRTGQLPNRPTVPPRGRPPDHQEAWPGQCRGANVSRNSRRARAPSLPSARGRCGSCWPERRTTGHSIRKPPLQLRARPTDARSERSGEGHRQQPH